MNTKRAVRQVTAISVLALILLCAGANGEVPNTISYQGILATSDGEIVPDGNYDLRFRLYSVQTGGSQLWQEDHNNVPVFQGRFHVILGSSIGLASVSFNEPYWLGITVEPPSTELPRIELTSSAYSLNARSVMDNAVTSDKIQDGSIGFADIGQNSASNGQIMKWNGYAWVAADENAGNTGWVDDGAYVRLKTSTDRVGIGTGSPSAKLEVAGTVYSTSGGFKFPDGTVQTSAASSSQSSVQGFFSFVTYKSDPPSGLIAYGVIDADGDVISGTSNVSCVWNSTYEHYEITISGENYYLWDYVTVVTPLGADPYTTATNSVSGKLIVFLFGSP